MQDTYDALIVGGRCAGAATAMLLARQGMSVLLIDRDRLGADTLSTLALMRAGVLQLHRWGLLDRVRAAGTPAIRSTSFVYDREDITLPIKPRDGVDALYAPRRTVLDALLAEAAAAAGARVVHGPRLVDLMRGRNGRVTGAVIEDREQATHRIEAGIVIGADGLKSTVARLVEAPIYRQGHHAGGVVYAFWPGLENRGNRWYYRPGVTVGAIPTNQGATCLFAGMRGSRFHDEIQADIEAGFHRVMEECSPQLAREMEGGRASERYRAFPGHPGLFRQSHGPGWALVGDAGYFKDPITAHGITDSLCAAELLARAVSRGSDEALAEYQSTRDNLCQELFEITDRIAGYEWNVDELKQLHLNLSKTMNREVEAMLQLDGAQSQPRSPDVPQPPSPVIEARRHGGHTDEHDHEQADR
ncbi:MAG TPA: NAD(P)/FAD-dependent oxidoreductase [Candidatus Eisenbacteria bacterium]|nr:NAD(P)/FAD-dependent oxidoreductase [Candidatus Eisenbacteria bacterium]